MYFWKNNNSGAKHFSAWTTLFYRDVTTEVRLGWLAVLQSGGSRHYSLFYVYLRTGLVFVVFCINSSGFSLNWLRRLDVNAGCWGLSNWHTHPTLFWFWVLEPTSQVPYQLLRAATLYLPCSSASSYGHQILLLSLTSSLLRCLGQLVASYVWINFLMIFQLSWMGSSTEAWVCCPEAWHRSHGYTMWSMSCARGWALGKVPPCFLGSFYSGQLSHSE